MAHKPSITACREEVHLWIFPICSRRWRRRHASDLYLSHGAPPCMVVAGKPRALGDKALSPTDTHAIAYSLMSDRQQKDFEATLEMNLGIAPVGIGRFRVNVYRQRGEVALAIRYISTDIPDIDTLRLPATLRDLIMLPRGLVLVVGATGSGKSTTLASMLDYRNRNRGGTHFDDRRSSGIPASASSVDHRSA